MPYTNNFYFIYNIRQLYNFQVWNKSVFGDVQRLVNLAAKEVARIQALIDVEGLDAALHVQELQAQLTLTKAMNSQDQF